MSGLPWLAVGFLLYAPSPPGITLSPDWAAERQPPYPNLVAAFRHRSEATLTVGVQFLGDGDDAESFARGNAEALRRMGFDVIQERDTLQARARGKDVAVRQIYIVRGTIGWVATLSGTPRQLRTLAKDLMAVASQILSATSSTP